jgi:phosphoglycolate phosphatase-like HAD superfamily hydrolase
MNLALFDIDGTLTHTSQVDAVCYVRAMELEFGLGDIDDDWSHYTFSSDPGIMNQVFEARLGRLPDKDDVAVFQRRFLALLKEERRKDPGLFAEIKGAAALLAALAASPDWCAALATGGWGVTAKFKLKAAGLPFNGLPFACGDDAVTREGIISIAMAKAGEVYGAGSFAKIVSLGDGVWDVKAARVLNIGFIGVGDKARLKAAGASAVVPDFSDTAACLALLDKAPGLTP